MSAPRIPEREPIGDAFQGMVIKTNEHLLLADTRIEAQEQVAIVHKGAFVVRYGIVYLGKPQYCIVPGLLALDYGAFLTGETAWEFLFNKSNLYPRADVLGYRNDGADDMIVVKELDLMYPIQLLVYASKNASKPLAQTRIVISQQPEELPARLAQYGDIHESIAAWQASLS